MPHQLTRMRATVRRWLRPLALSLAGAGLLGFASGTVAAEAKPALPPFDQKPYTHAQRLVTVAPGRRLNLYCTGHGRPVVMLDAGWGGPTTAWAYVQPTVAGFTEVCSYDRAGQGFSDAGPLPRDTDALVTDLHALLGAAGLPPPFVFVGHSLAGLDGVLFADRYRDELAGLLLVDPAFPHQDALMSRIPGVAGVLEKFKPDFAPCEAAARARRLPSDPKLVELCLNHDPSTSPALIAALDRMALHPELWTDLESEIASFGGAAGPGSRDIDSAELDRASRPFGHLPLVVLTAGNTLAIPGLAPAASAALFEVWNRGHDAIAARSSEGRNKMVPHSGHYIQLDQPAVVIAAIRALVTEARATAPPRPGRP